MEKQLPGSTWSTRTWTRRGMIEALDVQATLSVEDGQKAVRARCMLGEKVYNWSLANFQQLYCWTQIHRLAQKIYCKICGNLW